MRKMNHSEMRSTNGGGYHCDYCGWTTWSAGQMKNHQQAKHNCGGLFGRRYAYHFHWVIKCFAYESCR